jgi:hypothetical protein
MNKKMVSITVSGKVPVETEVEAELTQDKDLYELMDDNLSTEDLLSYMDSRGKTIVREPDMSEVLEIVREPEFLSELINAHYHGDIDLKKIADGII